MSPLLYEPAKPRRDEDRFLDIAIAIIAGAAALASAGFLVIERFIP